jgi:transcriptional regulator with XRE-family HTH domain
MTMGLIRRILEMSAKKIGDYSKPFAKQLLALMDNENGINPLGRKVTQQELADGIIACGYPIKRQTISLYLNGKSSPDMEKFKIIADFFHVSYDFLLGVSDATNRANVEITNELGLSEKSIDTLRKMRRNIDNKVNEYSILELTSLGYHPEDAKHLLSMHNKNIETTKRNEQIFHLAINLILSNNFETAMYPIIDYVIECLMFEDVTKYSGESASFNRELVQEYGDLIPPEIKETLLSNDTRIKKDHLNFTKWKMYEGMNQLADELVSLILKDARLTVV